MTSDQQTILNHYNITKRYPTAWPAEKDASEASEDEQPASKTGLAHKRSKSRYSALARSASDRRSLVPGTEKTGDGVENLVQKDEPDPLGGPHSVVHSNASTQSLLQGLEFLSKSIDQKSASLKVLVESNFERFVRAKITIDNVYAEMRNQGAEPPLPQRSQTQSRATSKGSAHFRKSSAQGPLSPRGIDKPLPSDKKKHALSKESEYGVQGIKAPLVEVAVKAEEIWGPALGGREREGALRLAMASVERSEGIFEVGTAIAGCIKRKDYEGLVNVYRRARKYAEEARAVAVGASSDRNLLDDAQIYQIVITARIWSGVESQIGDFKRDVWKRLTNVEASSATSVGLSAADEPMALIKVLLELGVEDNPIWFWLLSRYDYLKNKITASFERSRVEIEILRRRLGNADPPPPKSVVNYLKTPGASASHEMAQQLDTASILELWDLIHSSVSHLLSTSGGLLGEVIEFWDQAQAFIDGKTQRTLPLGPDAQSQRHHHLSPDGVMDLQNGVVELVEILRESIFAFFADPPIEDVSMLYSPLPPTTPNTPKSAVFAPWAHQDSRFQFDANNPPPPPSPKRDEAWEGFAFWPPYANALSGVHYLEKVLTLVGGAATEMAGLRPVSSSSTIQDSLKTLINGTRERCTNALLAAWTRDAGMFQLVETWERAGERRNLTKMPTYFLAYENAVLAGVQKLAYIPEVTNKGSVTSVITAPSSAMLKPVRRAFERSIYVLLSDMVKKAIERDPSEDVGHLQPTANATPPAGLTSKAGLNVEGHVESRFETNFSTRLIDEIKTIKDVLAQIDERLFGTYTKHIADHLASIIQTGITSPTWVPTTDRPTELRPYVYEALLVLVAIHTEILTTAPSLLHRIISSLFESIILAFLSAFRARTDRYTLAALMQATLDVEFVASILSQYTSPKASELQSQVYQELDQRTDNSARMRLQNELPEMRAILKKLREGTRGEFACFKRQKGGGGKG
ncbi:MAG: hypothetical protein Q9179_001833 [Wetmoreana sp. 5 TL-2023]